MEIKEYLNSLEDNAKKDVCELLCDIQYAVDDYNKDNQIGNRLEVIFKYNGEEIYLSKK